jgi:cell division septal protein FtsQ
MVGVLALKRKRPLSNSRFSNSEAKGIIIGFFNLIGLLLLLGGILFGFTMLSSTKYFQWAVVKGK